MNRVILPAELIAISNSHKTAGNSQRIFIDSAMSAVSQFSDNQDLSGESWANIKTQLLDYQTIFKGMLCALEEIDDDCERLQVGCGDEDLIENEIVDKIEQLQEVNRRYQEGIDQVLCAVKNNPLVALNPLTNLTIVNSGAAIASNAELIQLLEGKLQKIEEIEANTAGLFSTAAETLSLVEQGIAFIGAAWNGSGFTFNQDTSW